LANHLNDPNVRIIEVDISPKPYKNAHIPGAVFWNIFKSFNELKNIYHNEGITADKEVFPYCAIGGRSGYTWFVLKYLLGYPNVRNYDGSWNEWSRLPDVTIER
jgi:thiosulfate/3-mercaptopyruvate sulfurtransferase